MNNKWIIAAGTALALGLAGCNSGSSNRSNPEEPPAPAPELTPESISLSFLGRYSSGIFG
ncbi:hypothetical protein [Pseudomonas jilinensis]|nr:hypothetical protein [Pseudomonas jilinensis]